MAQPDKLSRKERERQVRRTEILQAAKRILRRKNFHQATLDEIAAEAEFGKGTLYNYFPGGKDELLLEVLDLIISDLIQLVKTSFDEHENDVRASLVDLVTGAFLYYAETGAFVILVREAQRILLAEDSELSRQCIERHEALYQVLADRFEKADVRLAQNLVPETCARFFLAGINTHFFHFAALELNIGDIDEAKLRKHAELSVHVLLNGLEA